MVDLCKTTLSLMVLVTCVTGGTLDNSKSLYTAKMTGYNKYIRPVEDQSEPVTVNISMEVVGIQDFDEVSETLTFIGVLVLNWEDESMQWDPADYGGMYTFTTSYKNVWVPELILINPSQAVDTLGSEWQMVRYYSNGLATWLPGDLWKTACSVDVTKFPFDTQKCDVKFLPWGYSSEEVLTQMTTNKVQKSYYSENGAWDLVDSEARSETNSGSEVTTFTLHLKRKPLFIVVNVILPIFFLSLLNVLVFLIPVESGERISYCITVLLSIAVFMTIVSDTLPKSSEPMSIIAYILMAELICSLLITFITILNLRLYYKEEHQELPKWLNMLVRICDRRKKVQGEADNPSKSLTGDQGQMLKPTLKKNQVFINRSKIHPLHQIADKETENAHQQTNPSKDIENDENWNSGSWKNVSGLVDKLSFLGFLLTNTSCMVVFVLVAYFR